MSSPPPLIELAGKKDTPKTAWIHTGTVFVKIDLHIPGRVPMTAIYLPDDYHPVDSVNMILYLHGHTSTGSIKEYLNKPEFPLRQILRLTGKNVVFVAPTLGNHSEIGRLASPSFAIEYIGLVLQSLSEYGPHDDVPTVRNLVLAAHSGGGLGMRTLAASYLGKFSVPECWGFDCMYGRDSPQCAPEPYRICGTKGHPPHSSFANLSEWDAGIMRSIEREWLDWAHDGRRFFTYWAQHSGTLTRTANLDLLSELHIIYDVFVIPELYNARKHIVRVTPRPVPRASHDLVPKTFFGERIISARFFDR